MLFNTPPISMTLGVRSSVPYPTGQAAQLIYALIQNSSPWTLTLDQGGRQLGYLPPFTINEYLLSATGQPINALPAQTGNPTSTSSQLWVSWSDDHFPGSWPSSLTADAITAAISGLVLTTPGLRLLGSFTVPNAASGSIGPIPVQSGDRYLIVAPGNNLDKGLWISSYLSGLTTSSVGVQDVLGVGGQWATVPITGLEGNVNLGYVYLGSPGLPPASSSVFVLAGSAPLAQPQATGFATASLVASGNAAFSFWGRGAGVPQCIRIRSADFHINGQAFADIFVGGTGGQSIYGVVAPAGGTGANNTSRSFGKGLIIGNGATLVGALDTSPAQMRLVASGLAAGNSVAVEFDFDWMV